MKVAICFIGTGKYLNFLPRYYENVHEYFLPNTEKQFLVFTDGDGDFPEDINTYDYEHIEWPYITLKRFEIIQKAKDVISETDWFVFIDADALVVDTVTEEEFFDDTKDFFGVHHPCHFLKMPPHNQKFGAFETNKKSTAAFQRMMIYLFTSKDVSGEESLQRLWILSANLIAEFKQIWITM
jgi:hypothetical protein